MIYVREEQERRRQEILAASSGDLNAQQEDDLVKTHATVKMRAQLMKTKLQQRAQLVDKYEKAFKKIHHATGLRDANELIDKYLNQDQKKQELDNAIREGEKTLEAKKEQVKGMHHEIEEIRFSGLGHFNKQRKDLDLQEDKNNFTESELENSEDAVHTLTDILRKSVLGITHLYRLLDEIREPENMQPISGSVGEDNAVDALHLIEAKGKMMLDRLDIEGAKTIEEYIILKKKKTFERPLIFVEAGDHASKLAKREAEIESQFNTLEDSEIESNEVDHISSARSKMKTTTNKALEVAQKQRKRLLRKSQANAYSNDEMDKLVKSHIKKAVFMPSVDERESIETPSFHPDEGREEKQKVDKKERKNKKRATVIKKRQKKKTRIRKR